MARGKGDGWKGRRLGLLRLWYGGFRRLRSRRPFVDESKGSFDRLISELRRVKAFARSLDTSPQILKRFLLAEDLNHRRHKPLQEAYFRKRIPLMVREHTQSHSQIL